MQRSLSLRFATYAFASLALLTGCGGGGGGSKGSTSTPTLPRGAVRTPNDVPITGAVVTFYDNSSDVALATTTVGSNGLIVGAIPTNARRFSIDASGVTVNVVDPTTGVRGDKPLYDTYTYNGNSYSASIAGCYPTLPRIGSAALDADIVFYPQGAGIVPPPPDGCFAP